MNKLIIVVLLLVSIGVGIYLFYNRDKCNWRPGQYGYCLTELGYYYDGTDCQVQNGCNDDAKLPFKDYAECTASCL